MPKASPQETMDVRVVERNVRKGLISEDDFRKYMSKLPDLAENCEAIEVPLPEGRRKAARLVRRAVVEQKDEGKEEE